MSAAYTSGFAEPACRDPREFGGKGAGLAGLTADGLPVASGFAIGTSAYRAFLDKSGLRSVVDGDDAADHIARRLETAPVPEAVASAIRGRYERLCDETGVAEVAVAVRSSATAEDSAAASFAGKYETWVDVVGAENVIAHVRRCWSGVFARHAVGYARMNGTDPRDIEMAVVVQKTVRARAAGVMFTISPVTGDRSRIVIEASWGLGLAVVGGEVTPDRWVVDKVGLAVVGCTPGDKRIEYRRGDGAVAVDPSRWAQPCLTDEQVIELARLGKRIERERCRPQDIEFAVDGNARPGTDLVLLQCRSETVWSARPPAPRFDAGQALTTWISDAVTDGAGNAA